MKKYTVIGWVLLIIGFGVFLNACGEKDKKKKNSDTYVEINSICYHQNENREVSRNYCIEEGSARLYTQYNRCYNSSSNEEVDRDACDPAFLAYGYQTTNIQGTQNRTCSGVMLTTSYQQVDCRLYNNCSGYYMIEPQTYTQVYCQ